MQPVFTIGHSTRSADELIALLEAYRIALVADVRKMPRSRRHPQFNTDTLAETLARHGILYRWMPALGGMRKPRLDSPNAGWRNPSFRAYADYMQTPDFAAALDALITEAETSRLAVMCAESLPWRCHRSLIADALTARGIEVFHIMSATRADAHALPLFAHAEGGRVTYPQAEQVP